MSQEIDIKGLDKADVLAALYNNSKPLGFGFLQASAAPMTKAEAQEVIDGQGFSFDYLRGRVMKINISEDTFNAWGYDRDNGQGAAGKVIDKLKADLAAGLAQTAPDNTAKFAKALEEFLENTDSLGLTAYPLGALDKNTGGVDAMAETKGVKLPVEPKMVRALKQAREKFPKMKK